MKARRTFVDPLLSWTGQHAYRLMAAYGITPESKTIEVLDALGKIPISERANQEILNSWQTLRDVVRRLEVDFFCYDLPEPPEAEAVTDLDLGHVRLQHRLLMKGAFSLDECEHFPATDLPPTWTGEPLTFLEGIENE